MIKVFKLVFKKVYDKNLAITFQMIARWDAGSAHKKI